MSFNPSFNKINPKMVETWLKGWSLAREVALPTRYKSGFKVNVGWPKQLVRYVFPNLEEDFFDLANTIYEPWHLLKVCASPTALIQRLPSRWTIQPAGFLMTCNKPMMLSAIELPKTYTLQEVKERQVHIAKVISEKGEVAAVGRIVFIDDIAIYDRIKTHPDHRRLGLATTVMKSLESYSLEHGINKSVLVATKEGKALYEKLGWQLVSLYTTVVIPGADESYSPSI